MAHSYAILVHGGFGPCFVNDEYSAGSRHRTDAKDQCKKFETETEARAFRDKYWPENEVSSEIIELS